MKYTPGDPPVSADPEQIKLWVLRELQGIARQINSVQGINFQRLAVIPARYAAGDAHYFLAGVVGASEGLYYFDGASWVFTG